jgi:hypothetical protein
MSTTQDKLKNSRRRQRDTNAVKKQTKIAKAHGIEVDEPHRYAKHHAMNCGNPKCVMCGNPRRTFKEPTLQEKRQLQDLGDQDQKPPVDQ